MSLKTVLCIRHGQSTFNALSPADGVDPLHYDAPLSELGHQQVRNARQTLITIAIDLVITSPLTRALQTTAGLFAQHPSSPTILVEPLHRERVENSCDVGRHPGLLAKEFPAFGLAHLSDVWWQADGTPDQRGICVEPMEKVHLRAGQFKRLLLQRTERSIAVVGHGTFFHVLTGQTLANCQIFEFTLVR